MDRGGDWLLLAGESYPAWSAPSNIPRTLFNAQSNIWLMTIIFLSFAALYRDNIVLSQILAIYEYSGALSASTLLLWPVPRPYKHCVGTRRTSRILEYRTEILIRFASCRHVGRI